MLPLIVGLIESVDFDQRDTDIVNAGITIS